MAPLMSSLSSLVALLQGLLLPKLCRSEFRSCSVMVCQWDSETTFRLRQKKDSLNHNTKGKKTKLSISDRPR